MNNYAIIFLSLFLQSCDKGEVENFVHLKIKLNYFNETSTPITIKYGSSCGFDEGSSISDEYLIPPDKNLILHITNPTYQGAGPSIDDIDLYLSAGCLIHYMDNLDSKCIGISEGFYDLTNYENRIKKAENSFEFSYRFTEEKKGLASICGG
jgi:hypothetical protein